MGFEDNSIGIGEPLRIHDPSPDLIYSLGGVVAPGRDFSKVADNVLINAAVSVKCFVAHPEIID